MLHREQRAFLNVSSSERDKWETGGTISLKSRSDLADVPNTLGIFLNLINQYEFKVSCMASWEEQGLAGSGFNFVYDL